MNFCKLFGRPWQPDSREKEDNDPATVELPPESYKLKSASTSLFLVDLQGEVWLAGADATAQRTNEEHKLFFSRFATDDVARIQQAISTACLSKEPIHVEGVRERAADRPLNLVLIPIVYPRLSTSFCAAILGETTRFMADQPTSSVPPDSFDNVLPGIPEEPRSELRDEPVHEKSPSECSWGPQQSPPPSEQPGCSPSQLSNVISHSSAFRSQAHSVERASGSAGSDSLRYSDSNQSFSASGSDSFQYRPQGPAPEALAKSDSARFSDNSPIRFNSEGSASSLLMSQEQRKACRVFINQMAQTESVEQCTIPTQTDVAWSSNGFQCRNCSKPPLQPGSLAAAEAARAMAVADRAPRKKLKLGKRGPLDGVWTILAEHQNEAASWLYRLHFSGGTCLDNQGQMSILQRHGNQLYLEGGRLLLEGSNLLHRQGKSGKRLLFVRGDGGIPLGEPVPTGLPPMWTNPLSKASRVQPAKRLPTTQDHACESEEDLGDGSDHGDDDLLGDPQVPPLQHRAQSAPALQDQLRVLRGSCA